MKILDSKLIISRVLLIMITMVLSDQFGMMFPSTIRRVEIRGVCIIIPLMHASSMFDIIDHSYITVFDAFALNDFLP